MGLFSKGIEMTHDVGQVIIGRVRLKAELVLQSNGETNQKIKGGPFCSVRSDILKSRVHD